MDGLNEGGLLSEAGGVVVKPQQQTAVVSSQTKKRMWSLVAIIVTVCLVFLGGGFLLLRKSLKEKVTGTSSSLSGFSDRGGVDRDECHEVWRLIDLNERALKAIPDVDPSRKVIFNSRDTVPPQFPGSHFPVFSGLKLCYSSAVERQDNQGVGTSTSFVVYYVVSSVVEASKWYAENIVKSDLALKPLPEGNPLKKLSSNYPVLQRLRAKGDYDSYYWETGCCSPDQPSESFAQIDISHDETFPVVAFMYYIDVFHYKK